jgi:metallo-beta-lactamase family protein
VVHHLKAFAPDRRNTILFAGFQAGGTRGATIVGGADSVRIFGQDVPIRAEVVSLDNLSAHGDAGEIIGWLRGFKSPPRTTFITHGEPAAADAMRQRIERELHWHCHMPCYLESIELRLCARTSPGCGPPAGSGRTPSRSRAGRSRPLR